MMERLATARNARQ